MNFPTLCNVWVRYPSTFEKKLRNRESKKIMKPHSPMQVFAPLKPKMKKSYKKYSATFKYLQKNQKPPTF